VTPIVLDAIDEPDVWNLIRWMTERSTDWVLIGGLMVATFDLEHGDPWRQTHDIDSLFDVRHATSASSSSPRDTASDIDSSAAHSSSTCSQPITFPRIRS
jgi:hypothetical protein